MSLCITDILGKKKVRKLWSCIEANDLQYSTLINLYQAADKQKIDMIREKKTSFLDIVIDWRLGNGTEPSQSESVRNAVYSALIQKIRVGLMALDKMPLPQICSQILQLGPNFASEDLVRSVCCSNSQYFTVKQTGRGSIVQIAQAKITKAAGEKEKPATSKPPCESRAKELLKHFYKTESNMIAAFDHGARFKDILLAYEFWDRNVTADSSGEFIVWLLALAKAKSEEDLPKYQENLNTLLGNRIVDFIRSSARTIGQITENLCIDRKRFLTHAMVRRVVMNNPEKMFLANSAGQLDQQLVEVTRLVKIYYNELDLPEYLEARVKPLLSLNATHDNVLNNFKVLYLDHQMVENISKCGCFFNYLVQYGRVHKEKLPLEEFTQHLYSFVRPYLLSALKSSSSGVTGVDNVIARAPVGLLDAAFVRHAAQFWSADFAVMSDNHHIVLKTVREATPPIQSEESELPPAVENPAADLESPCVMHLLAKRPNLDEILDVFSTLSPASICVLANSSMSFLEWLISLSKRLMPHDAPIFESHLQSVVQREVANIHSRQRCQMTVQHVHCLICAGQPMLLSPNFLSWCLEQPESSFCVYQSWIYLRNSAGRRISKDESPEASTSGEGPVELKQEFSADSFLRRIREWSKLSDLRQAIRAVPLQHVGFVLQNCASWYDFMENNLRDRKDREHLSSLFSDEVKDGLGGGVHLARDLVSMLSKGVANFVSKDALEYILNHCPDTFAIAGMGRDNCKVGIVRQIQGGEVKCCNDQEEAFMRQILLYFPSSGSADISTVLCLIKREDSFLYKKNEMVDDDFLRCFFKMFPMHFYLQGEKVVLTCMALDKKAEYKSALYPTSTTGADVSESRSSKQGSSPRESSRKRQKSHSRRDRGKRKRKRSISKGRQPSRERGEDLDTSPEVIVIEESSEEEVTPDVTFSQRKDETEISLVVDESDGEAESLIHIIDGLPGGLVTDIASSILIRNGGRYPTNDLIIELLFATTAADESQRIQASIKLFSLFKKKIFRVLQENDAKFVLVPHPHVPDDVIEVKMRQAERAQADSQSTEPEENVVRDSPDPQVEEITSTSETPGRARREPVASPSNSSVASDIMNPPTEDDVIKLPESSFEKEETASFTEMKVCAEESAGKAEEKQQSSAALTPVDEAAIGTDVVDSLIVAPNAGSSTAQTSTNSPLPTYSFAASNGAKPVLPSYSSSSACTAYAKDSQSVSAPKPQSISPRSYREHCLKEFFKSYLKINAGSCATELLIDSAFRRFQSERFARSALAFEAYVYDFIVKHHNTFVLSGASSDLGVSKVCYRRGSPTTSPEFLQEPANLDFMKLEPEVCSSCCAYLNSRSKSRSSVDDLCVAIKGVFRAKLDKIPENEIDGVVRCLVLVSTIRNLALFCFAIQEPCLYLRNQKHPAEEAPLPQQHRAEIGMILQNRKVKKAVLLMAKIVEKSRPKSHTSLRRLWQAEAPIDVAKVFGTGISFTLSIRKYQFIFPTSEDGTVLVNNEVLAAIRDG